MFNVFGFDILLDDKLNPSLLEVNTRPSMHIYDKMDKIIKTNIFVDTLNIVGITPFSHKKNYEPFDKYYKYKNRVNEAVSKALCELSRPRGSFELIFPLKSNIDLYQKFFFHNISNENKLFWKNIKNKK